MPPWESGSPFAVVERSTRVPFPAEVVYQWHRRPGSFERLTPPWERVEVLERTGGRQFVDEPAEGPFAHWIHTHRFVPDGEAASLIIDRVEYAPPYGPIGRAAGFWLARRRVERLLAYRHALLPADLAAHARFAGRPPLRIAITGASGLIGRALSPFLT